MRGSSARFMSSAVVLILLLSIVLLSAAGCKQSLLDPKEPVTLAMWHNYGGQMKNLMDEMIDEFNSTIGAEQGIIISVTAISGSSELHDMLTAAAEEVPGAMPLPDITTSYPKTAVILKQHDKLVDLSEHFSKSKLDEYVPAFVDEGRLDDEGLYVFPIAKSTEVLFVNQTLFDRFAAENDIGYEDLATFEGIAAASMAYLNWTDRQTPDVPGDGKAFFMADSLFNQALVGSRQLNEKFLLLNDEDSSSAEAQLNISSPAHSRIWGINYIPSVCGGIAAFDGYSSDLFKTGDLVCAVGSTAGVLFYPDVVTYPDNTKEDASYAILPYPTYINGKKAALQRGGGMCVIKSDRAREYAASVFLEWFTRPEQNLRFTLSSGYLPVAKEAFDSLLSCVGSGASVSASGTAQSINIKVEDERIKQQLKTILQMYDEYEFFYTPHAQNSEKLQSSYEEQVLAVILASREEVASSYGQSSYFSIEPADAVGAMSDSARQSLKVKLGID